ncbi:MAG: N-formylglutamate amidohydrolase, partial [Pseudomonadota bacterium]
DILTRHIAWDIGTAALTNALSAALDCEAVLSKVSRLVVDKNRRIDQPGLMPEVSDTVMIPGNQGLSSAAIEARLDGYYHPYHAALADAVVRKADPVLISVHSFTPEMNGIQRPWHCGFLYNRDDRLARRAIKHFKALDLTVGDNQPYPGNVFNATMDRHAEAASHPYLMLEVRNDLLQTNHQIAWWCEQIVGFLSTV